MESIKIAVYPRSGQGWTVALEIRQWVAGSPRGRVTRSMLPLALPVHENAPAGVVADMIYRAICEMEVPFPLPLT